MALPEQLLRVRLIEDVIGTNAWVKLAQGLADADRHNDASALVQGGSCVGKQDSPYTADPARRQHPRPGHAAARRLHHRIADSRLLVTDVNGHVSYVNSACARERETEYLISAAMPARLTYGLWCACSTMASLDLIQRNNSWPGVVAADCSTLVM